mmetsp:Transcript_73957/g.220673  ORF Transcript_73957/g.220673 Transcript_73957/m.220673 type:complete len:241 (-) Transcript_73957:79-801(-)
MTPPPHGSSAISWAVSGCFRTALMEERNSFTVAPRSCWRIGASSSASRCFPGHQGTILKVRAAGRPCPSVEPWSSSSTSLSSGRSCPAEAVVAFEVVRDPAGSFEEAREAFPSRSAQCAGADPRQVRASCTIMASASAPPALPADPVSKFASTAESCANGWSICRRPSPSTSPWSPLLGMRENWTSRSRSCAAASSATRRTSAESIRALLRESRGPWSSSSDQRGAAMPGMAVGSRVQRL